MCYKYIKIKYCSKTQFFELIGVLLHYKIQMHVKGSNTTVLQTTIVFKGIKVLLHCKMSSRGSNAIAL